MGYLKEQILKDTGITELTIQQISKKAEKITDEQRHQAIANMKCAICGSKLNAYCYAEDEFAIECINCDLLYKE